MASTPSEGTPSEGTPSEGTPSSTPSASPEAADDVILRGVNTQDGKFYEIRGTLIYL